MIILLTGLISSGKDTVAQYLCQNHNFVKLSFAGALKDTLSVIFGWDRELLEGSTPESRMWREEVDVWWADRLGIPNFSPRWALQHFGTEVFRNTFHRDIWVAVVENKLRHATSNTVITDGRFVNEMMSVKKAGGLIGRVTRGSNPIWYSLAEEYNTTSDPIAKANYKNILENEHKVHESEYASVGFSYDFYIDNNGSLENTFGQISEIVRNNQ